MPPLYKDDTLAFMYGIQRTRRMCNNAAEYVLGCLRTKIKQEAESKTTRSNTDVTCGKYLMLKLCALFKIIWYTSTMAIQRLDWSSEVSQRAASH